MCALGGESKDVMVIDKENRIVVYRFDGGEKAFKEDVVIEEVLERKKEGEEEERFTIALVMRNM